MKKLLLILLCLPIIGFGQVKSNKSIFNFKKINNYSKTYTYNSQATSYYVLSEIVYWDCIRSGKSIKECTSFEKIYYFLSGDSVTELINLKISNINFKQGDKKVIGKGDIECVEFDSLEWNGWSARKGVKYKGELFTGTACGYIYKKSGEIVEPKNYIEGKLNGYYCSYYKNGNKCFEAYYENGNPMKGKPSSWWNEDGTLFKRWEH